MNVTRLQTFQILVRFTSHYDSNKKITVTFVNYTPVSQHLSAARRVITFSSNSMTLCFYFNSCVLPLTYAKHLLGTTT